MRLQGPHFVDVGLRHRFDGLVGRRHTVDAGSLQSVDGLLWHGAGEIAEIDDVSTRAVNDEERKAIGIALLHGHERFETLAVALAPRRGP